MQGIAANPEREWGRKNEFLPESFAGLRQLPSIHPETMIQSA
jgi:hypothetical protein